MSTIMPAVNTVTLVGHLTADPILKALADGQSVCNMRLAVNDQADQTMYIDVATFGKSAEACAQYLAKGRQVAVTGRLTYQQWATNDGNKRSKHSVIGQVHFGGKPTAEDPERGDE